MTGHEPLELFMRNFQDILFCPGPLVFAIQKPLIEQQESVTFPYEALDFIRFPATEHEKDILLKWVNIQLAANDCTQTIDTLAKICVAAGDIDTVEAGGIIQHGALPAVPVLEQNDLHP